MGSDGGVSDPMNHQVQIRTMKTMNAGLNHFDLLNDECQTKLPSQDKISQIENNANVVIRSPTVRIKKHNNQPPNIRKLIKGSYTRN